MLARKSVAVAILAMVGLVLLQTMSLLPIPRVTASVERVFEPVDDAWVDVVWNPEDPHDDTELWVGRGQYAKDRAYLKFDLSPIPIGATIDSAWLILRMSSTKDTWPRDVAVHYCSDDSWYEETITGETAPSYEPDPADTETVEGVDTYIWHVTSAVNSALFKHKVSFVVKWDDEGGFFIGDHTKKFSSKEAGTDHPILEVRYSVDGEEASAVGGLTPTVDGVIGSTEWNDADSFRFAVRWTRNPYEITTYVKQDSNELYIGFYIPDKTQMDMDAATLYFDTDHDNATAPQTDDRQYRVYRNGTSTRSTGNGTQWAREPSVDWSVVMTTSSTDWQIEFSFSYSELSVTAGEAKELGFGVQYWDFNAGVEFAGWPSGAGSSPTSWGDIVSVPPHWIPEFSTWTSMLLILVMLTVAIATYKRRLPKTTTH